MTFNREPILVDTARSNFHPAVSWFVLLCTDRQGTGTGTDRSKRAACLRSETTCTDTSILLNAFAGPSHAPETAQAFSCSRATATETCSLPASLLLVGSKPRQPAPGM